jgi:hypothetical protein
VRLGIPTVMATLALGGVAVLYLRVEKLERDLGAQRVVATPARETGRLELPPVSRDPEGGEAEPDGERAPAASAPAGGTATRAATIEDRLAKLEQRQQALESGRAEGAPWRRHEQRFARSVEDLGRKLSLTPTQQARVEDAVGRGRQRIEDVLKIPDETGKSPFERRADARKKLEEAVKGAQPGGVLALATDLVSYRDRKIPGRNETYGDAIDRIRNDTRDEIRGSLSATQQETFDQTNVDGLLGDTGQVSFAYTLGDAGGGGGAGIIVDTESHVEDGSPPAAPGASPEDGGR